IKEIEELHGEIKILKGQLQKERFKNENYEVLVKYKIGSPISSDIIISDIQVRENLKEVAQSFFSAILNSVKGEKSNEEAIKEIKEIKYFFIFECIDLKSKQKIYLNLEEVKKLEKEFKIDK
uniref:hypothetical protein n=1 Tax=uncultured Tenacibaculum sp. TaxID=174713 RepID=UPI00262074C8